MSPKTRRTQQASVQAAVVTEELQLALTQASAELPWKILELISKAQLAGETFKLYAPEGSKGWDIWFEVNDSLISFSPLTLGSESELNNLEWELITIDHALDGVLADQAAAKVRQARKVELLASLSKEDKEILGLTKPKNPTSLTLNE